MGNDAATYRQNADILKAAQSFEGGGSAALSDDGQSLVLRVFGGLHRGAEIELHDGRYRIGKNPECEIVFEDDGIADVHADLRIQGGQVFLLPQKGPIAIDGKMIEGPEHRIEAGQVITTGRGLWGVMPAGASFQIPSTELLRPSKPQSSVAASAATVGRKKTALRVMLGCGLLALTVFIYMGVFWLCQPRQIQSTAYVDEIKRLCERFKVTQCTVAPQADGSIEVSGYIETKSQKNALTAALTKLPIPVDKQIHAEDEIVSLCRAFFKTMGLPVHVSYAGQGLLTLNGFAEITTDIPTLAERLRKEVDGIRRLHANIFGLDRIMPELEEQLATARLDKKITFTPQAGYLEAAGELTPSEKDKWLQAKLKIQNKYGADLVIADKILETEEVEPLPGKILLPIVGVSVLDPPYISLKGGRKVFLGGLIKNDTIVKDIQEDKVVVAINGREYHYNFE